MEVEIRSMESISDLDSFGGGGVKLQNPGVRLIGERLDEESKPLQSPNHGLAELSQLPTFFGFFALIFIVKPRVFIVAFWKNGRVKTKSLPFDTGVLAVCCQHVSAQHPSQKRRQGSSLLQHRRKPSHRFRQDGAANRSLSRRDQRSTTSDMAQNAVGVTR